MVKVQFIEEGVVDVGDFDGGSREVVLGVGLVEMLVMVKRREVEIQGDETTLYAFGVPTKPQAQAGQDDVPVLAGADLGPTGGVTIWMIDADVDANGPEIAALEYDRQKCAR